MHDTVWTDARGKKHKQKLVRKEEPIGAEQCLSERGVPTAGLKLDEIVEKLNEFDDFKAEIVAGRAVEQLVSDWNKRNGRQHRILWVPKYHCELNWIERKWGFIKSKIKHHTTGSMPGLTAAYHTVIQLLHVTTCRRFARKARDYMHAYEDGVSTAEIEKAVSTTYKSHRRVFDSTLSLVLPQHRTLTALEAKWAARTAKRKETEARRADEHRKEVRNKKARERRIARESKLDADGSKKKSRVADADAAREKLCRKRKRRNDTEPVPTPDATGFDECYVLIE